MKYSEIRESLINNSGASGNNTETIKSIERLLEERKQR